MQNLVFIAHGYCLAFLDKSLYCEDTRTWQWGPVIPQLYRSLQVYGSRDVEKDIEAKDILKKETREYKIVEAVYKNYSHYSGSQLSALTHQEDTPWRITWNSEKFGVIDIKTISDHYKRLICRCCQMAIPNKQSKIINLPQRSNWGWTKPSVYYD